MKILCFSDLHRDQAKARKLVELSEDADLVIGAGDFANRHQGLADTLDILGNISKPSVLVPGNGETVEELTDAIVNWESATVLHGTGLEILGVPIWGVGGGIPVTPFGEWSYDFNEQQATKLLSGCQAGGLLVVHSPPINTVDRDSSGKIRGSQSIRECVETKQPRLVVCGHIHDDWEKSVTVGQSLIQNAGPNGVMLELEF